MTFTLASDRENTSSVYFTYKNDSEQQRPYESSDD